MASSRVAHIVSSVNYAGLPGLMLTVWSLKDFSESCEQHTIYQLKYHAKWSRLNFRGLMLDDYVLIATLSQVRVPALSFNVHQFKPHVFLGVVTITCDPSSKCFHKLACEYSLLYSYDILKYLVSTICKLFSQPIVAGINLYIHRYFHKHSLIYLVSLVVLLCVGFRPLGVTTWKYMSWSFCMLRIYLHSWRFKQFTANSWRGEVLNVVRFSRLMSSVGVYTL